MHDFRHFDLTHCEEWDPQRIKFYDSLLYFPVFFHVFLYPDMREKGFKREPFTEILAYIWCFYRADSDTGRFHTSQRKLAEVWGWDKNRVRAFLGRMVKHHWLLVESWPEGTTITVVRYPRGGGHG